VGKNVPTSREEIVHVHVAETDGSDEVSIARELRAPDATAAGNS
jgi:pyrimidine operon attenuation protein/uracil phosphoribosyltransferase